MNECKSKTKIAELAKDPHFVDLANDYLSTFALMSALREEIRDIAAFPRIIQLAVDRLLEYHKEVVKAEAELESRGVSKTDVFAWQYDSIASQR